MKLSVYWTARRSNQSILREINPEYPLEGLTLKLKCQYFGHLVRRVDSLEKTLMLGKTEGKRRTRQPRMRGQDRITDSAWDIDLSKLWEAVKDRGGLPAAVHGATERQIRLSNWTRTNQHYKKGTGNHFSFLSVAKYDRSQTPWSLSQKAMQDLW